VYSVVRTPNSPDELGCEMRCTVSCSQVRRSPHGSGGAVEERSDEAEGAASRYLEPGPPPTSAYGRSSSQSPVSTAAQPGGRSSFELRVLSKCPTRFEVGGRRRPAAAPRRSLNEGLVQGSYRADARLGPGEHFVRATTCLGG
jgi:hypothetical protein